MSPHRLRSARGHAALEYVAVLAIVAGVLAASGTAVAAPDVAGAVERALREGLCRVAGGVCSVAQAGAERLSPCLVHVRSDDERLRVTVGVVRGGRGDALLVERRSDGSATVSFVDGWEGGAQAGVGVSFAPLGLEGRAAATAGVRFAGGAVWEFRDRAAADRFVARYAAGEALRGEAERLVPFRDDGPQPPVPHATYTEGGPFADGELDAQIPLLGRRGRLEASGDAIAVLGRREQGATTTWSVRVSGDALARLGLVLGAVGAEGTREGVLEYTTVAGRPATATIRTSGGIAADIGVFGARTDLGALARRLRGVGGGGAAAARGGLHVDASVSLDLTDQENLAAVRGVLRSQHPVAAVAAVRALAGRLDAAGDVDLAVLRTRTRRHATGVEAGIGPGLGAGYEHVVRTRDLVRAWTATRGGSLREREDCAPV